MTITSTEFQQNIGYYMKLADQGETIIIRKLKPSGKTYTLKSAITTNSYTPKNILKKIKTIKPIDWYEDGVSFQRKVRS